MDRIEQEHIVSMIRKCVLVHPVLPILKNNHIARLAKP